MHDYNLQKYSLIQFVDSYMYNYNPNYYYRLYVHVYNNVKCIMNDIINYALHILHSIVYHCIIIVHIKLKLLYTVQYTL